VQASQQAVLKAKADLIAAKARVKKSESDIDEAKANVAVAEAKKVRADALLSYTQIHSPYDGVITNRTFLRGAFIRSAVEGGNTPLLRVARTDKVRVITQVPDLAVPYLDVGDPAEITLDALPGQVFKGEVSRYADAEDPESRTMHTSSTRRARTPRYRPHAWSASRAAATPTFMSSRTARPTSSGSRSAWTTV
jgi:multidrug resistance efflux pump